jgi:hypothetical protein
MGWEVHAMAAFADHRHTDSTLQYIHLSGRDLADKLAAGMDHIHAWRVEMLTAGTRRRPRGDRVVGPGGRRRGGRSLDLADR